MKELDVDSAADVVPGDQDASQLTVVVGGVTHTASALEAWRMQDWRGVDSLWFQGAPD